MGCYDVVHVSDQVARHLLMYCPTCEVVAANEYQTKCLGADMQEYRLAYTQEDHNVRLRKLNSLDTEHNEYKGNPNAPVVDLNMGELPNEPIWIYTYCECGRWLEFILQFNKGCVERVKFCHR